MGPYRILIGSAVLVASFAYGIGVGRFGWPPATWLRSAHDRILGPAPTDQVPYVAARISIFRNTPGQADIVMLGDSLTEGGNWQDILPDIRVMNRGITSDRSSGVLARLPEVISRRPRQVFLMIGVNDLFRGGTPEGTAETIGRIIRTLQEAQISPLLHSVVFVGEGHPDINASIQRLNDMLRETARRADVPFIDLNPILAPSGRLAPEFTYDGLHFRGEAYIRWRDAIRPFIATGQRD